MQLGLRVTLWPCMLLWKNPTRPSWASGRGTHCLRLAITCLMSSSPPPGGTRVASSSPGQTQACYTNPTRDPWAAERPTLAMPAKALLRTSLKDTCVDRGEPQGHRKPRGGLVYRVGCVGTHCGQALHKHGPKAPGQACPW